MKRHSSLRSSALVCSVLIVVCLGCSRKHYRTHADRDVAAIYQEKRCEEAYTLPELPGIDVDPRSRFFDPTPTDCPVLPAPEPALQGYELPMLATGDPHEPRPILRESEGGPSDSSPEGIPQGTAQPDPDWVHAGEDESDVSLVESLSLPELIESEALEGLAGTPAVLSQPQSVPVPSAVRLAQLIEAEGENALGNLSGEELVDEIDQSEDPDGFRIVPIPDTSWAELPERCVTRMLEFGSIRKEFRNSFPNTQPGTVEGLLSDAPRVTLRMIAELAKVNSRELQTRKEELYEAALRLSAERYQYVLRPTKLNGTDLIYNYDRVSSVSQNGVFVPTVAQVRKTTAMAGQFIATFANNVLVTFDGPQGLATNVESELLLDFYQTIFQRDVVFEELTSSERAVIYSARDLIRFQRTLFVDLAGDYYRLLLTYRAIEIRSQDYFSNLRAFLQGKAEYLQAGRIPRIQVDQFEQEALSSRSALVNACNSLESSLDDLKILMGLPPEMPVNVNLFELESLTTSDELTVTRELVMRTRQTLIDAAETRLGDRDAAVNGATVLVNRLTDTLRVRRKIEAAALAGEMPPETDAERETKQLGRRLALLEARLQSDQLAAIRTRELKSDLPPPALIQFARTADLIESNLLQAKRASSVRSGMDLDFELPPDVVRFQLEVADLRGLWDDAIENRKLDELPALVSDADELLKKTGDLTAQVVGDLLPIEGPALEEYIVQIVADTVSLVDRIDTSDVDSVDEVDVDENEAMLIALYQRLDLMNRRGRLADARRQIKLAADDLKAVVDIRVTQTLRTDRLTNDFFDLRANGNSTRLSFGLDTPLNRRLERNAYRIALIDYQRGLRSLIQDEDNIKLQVREDLRQLRLQRDQYGISVARAALAYERVVSTRLKLQLAVGDVVARDFLEAQQDYTSALNSVAEDHISYIRGRIQLFFHAESIQLDSNAYWSGTTDEALDLPPRPDFYDVNPNPYGRLPECLHYSDEIRRNH